MSSRGTTALGVRYYHVSADVKNYIRPYYRTGAALGLGATVLRLQRSGTTVNPTVLPQVLAVLPLLRAVLPQVQQ